MFDKDDHISIRKYNFHNNFQSEQNIRVSLIVIMINFNQISRQILSEFFNKKKNRKY